MQIKTMNPATEEVLETYPLFSEEQIDAFIKAAHVSWQAWRKTTFEQRRNKMLAMATLLRQKQTEFALLMAREMGKPITAGQKEIEKCAWVCEHFAEQAESYLAPRLIDTDMRKTKICYQPLGVVFGIMPWNFPFWQVFRFAVPTIMAGNAAILKHAPICTATGNTIAALFLEAGFPEHLFQHFILDNALAAKVIAHDNIVGVSLTGSEQAGRAVASEAGRHLKKAVLELGGNDPYVVLADAPLEEAADCIVTSRMNNTGQVCIAAKRIIVVKTIFDNLLNAITERVQAYQMGDPLLSETNFGPMARKDLRETLHQQVLESEQQGAKILIGGQMPEGTGFYYPPTILTQVRSGMPAFDEELFGPVIAMIQAEDEAHAIQLANQSQYGLGAAVFTHDLERGEQLATEAIDVGSCFVNTLVSSDPRVPFGGIKCSGFGREISREGMLEFVNVKTVSIK